jgi:hypothetical protein
MIIMKGRGGALVWLFLLGKPEELPRNVGLHNLTTLSAVYTSVIPSFSGILWFLAIARLCLQIY